MRLDRLRYDDAHLPVIALALAVLVFTVQTPLLVAVVHTSLAVAFLVSSVLAVAIVAAVRYPRVAMAVAAVAVAVTAWSVPPEGHGTWPVSQPQLPAIAAVLFIASLRLGWVAALVLWWLSNAVIVALVIAIPTHRASPAEWGPSLIATVTTTLIAVVAAQLWTRWRAIRAELERARRDIRLEQMKTAYEQERREIARDMHDLVAHSMSIVHMTAMSAPYRLPAMDDAVAHEFEVITATAKNALQEMRQLMSVLHRGGENAPSRPQPTVADIEAAVAATVAAGAQVELHIDPGAHSAPNSVQLIAFRTVQEALSNAIRHAPGAPITVTVSIRTPTGPASTADEGAVFGGDSMLVSVVNGPPTQHTTTIGALDAGGRGLLGIRERVDLVHGTMDAGPTPDHGYHLRAHLPMSASAAAETTPTSETS